LSSPFHVLADLLATRAGSIEVLLNVSLDLRSAAASGCDFVAKLPQAIGQLGLINGRRELL